MTSTYTATIWSDTYRLRANWAEASSPIERETEFGWDATGAQVADYGHSPARAMRAELEAAAHASGDASERMRVAIEHAIVGMRP